MTNSQEKDKKEKPYNLEERTALYGEAIIQFCKTLPKDTTTFSIVGQCIRSGTAVGSNYCEADCAESKKDFEHKMGIANKEIKETKYWLRMIASAFQDKKDEARRLWKEAHELNLIFSTIIRNSKNNRSRQE